MEGGHRAALEDLQRHIGGVGTEVGVVHAAGREAPGRHEGVGAGVVGDASLGEDLAHGSGRVHDGVVGRGKDGIDLGGSEGVRGGEHLVGGVAGLFHILDALAVEIGLGVGDGGGGVRLGVGVQQADGLDVGVRGEDHVHDGVGVERVARAGDVVKPGQTGRLRVGDRGIDDGDAAVGSVRHALGCQRTDGDDRVIPAAHDLRADLVEDGAIVLSVEVLIGDGHALGRGVKLGLNGVADLIERGVVELLHDGNLEGLAVVVIAIGAGVIAAADKSGQAQGGGKDQSHNLFHGVFPLSFNLK